VNHPLWVQAETAERENRLADAEKAYFDLAAVMNGPGGDHDIANMCYTRIHAIRERKRASNTGAGSGQTVQDNRGVRAGAPQVLPTATGGSNSTAHSGPYGSANTRPDPAASGDHPEWIGPGTLRVSALTLDGTDPKRRTYVLESSPGVVKVYVLAAPGVDLSKFVLKRVSVYGTAQTRSGLSKQYVIASNVEEAP
jgi:hypothetical protein